MAPNACFVWLQMPVSIGYKYLFLVASKTKTKNKKNACFVWPCGTPPKSRLSDML